MVLIKRCQYCSWQNVNVLLWSHVRYIHNHASLSLKQTNILWFRATGSHNKLMLLHNYIDIGSGVFMFVVTDQLSHGVFLTFRSTSTISLEPQAAATCNGVQRSLSWTLTLAPCSRIIFTPSRSSFTQHWEIGRSGVRDGEVGGVGWGGRKWNETWRKEVRCEKCGEGVGGMGDVGRIST